MTSHETKGELNELQILINLIQGKIRITYPLYPDFDILKADPEADGYSLETPVNEHDFKEKRSQFDRHKEELPSYHDLVECLLSSRTISYENVEEVQKKIKYQIENAPRKVLFCPDTNILYHNFLSSIERITPDKIGIVTTVKDEIEASMNHKYSSSDIRELKDSASYHPKLLNELSNRRKKKSRKAAYLAKREYKKYSGIEIPAIKESTKNQEENDQTIAKSINEYEKKNNIRTVLLTADTQMADICDIEGINCFHLKYPENYKLDKCSHRKLLKLIFDLSVTFGFIKLNSVVIFGEFPGKGPDEPNKMKMKFLDSKLYKKFKKHQKICRKLNQLQINK